MTCKGRAPDPSVHTSSIKSAWIRQLPTSVAGHAQGDTQIAFGAKPIKVNRTFRYPLYWPTEEEKGRVSFQKGGKCEMSQRQEKFEGQKTRIITHIAELSRLLGMIPSDDTIQIDEPLTQNKMVLSDWFSATRDSFLKLSLLISKELDIQLQ
jgi:hypothetical protein